MPPYDISPEYDIVIVGAGPAGCTAARYLSDKFSVLMIDKASFPRNKPCGGLLVEESQTFIKPLEPLDFIFPKPKKLKLELVDWGNGLKVEIDRDYVNVIRHKFDYWLMQLVGDKVAFMDKTELSDFILRDGGMNLVLNRDNKTHIVKARYLIGADGAGSTVRKKISPKPIRTYVAIQETVDFELNSHAYFIYDDEITDFYSWAIPKNGKLVIGSALRMNNGSIREKFDLLKAKLARNMGIEGQYDNKESCLLVRPETVEDIILGKGNILLAGEAAGLISPSTSEGISFALRSGKLAAHALNGMKDVLAEYTGLCSPLVEEISDRLLKSSALSERKSRKSVMERWHALSEPLGQQKAAELWSK
jgi:geranylgeranyl diphosphate/geranylgeranyl-bacteriochlorophyllide a reductase